MRELFLEIWTSVRRNKLRTALTGFSVAWGIFMLVILLGSGNGLKNGVNSNFGDYATNSLDLYSNYTSKPYAGYEKNRRIRLYENDIKILEREFPEIDEVAAQAWYSSKKATYGNEFTAVWVCGIMPALAQMEGIKLSAGRFINDTDLHDYRKVIVIDEMMNRLFFKGKSPLGKQVKVGTSVFMVIGVQKGDAERNNSSCYIPLTTAQLLYKQNNPEVNNITLTVKGLDTDQQLADFEKRLRRRLAAEHQFDPEDESAIWIDNTMERYKSFQMIFWGINLFVWIIGLGTLLAGVVGVSNIMLVTVTERTAEFGIRKALGAKPASIIRLILTESVCITAAFGYIGMVLGIAVMEGVNWILTQGGGGSDGPSIFLNPTLDLRVVVSATIVLVGAGLVAGYIPAYRAAQLKTIDALRYNK
ncbi:MAG: ABC transporter permease [Alistipes senegalensis]|nr:ABC transporter permease [Bacteroides cellulosilyticus]MCM1351606.1 ABC transporter permease [Alistipes senegalensis]